jgi:subtilisin-like proprotein convertase family protein
MKNSTHFQQFLFMALLLIAIIFDFGISGKDVSAQTFTATGLPQSIPDGVSTNCWATPGTPLTSTIQVSGVPGNVSSSGQITINFNLSHTWSGDLMVSITPPSGTAINLINRLGSDICGYNSGFVAANQLSFNSLNSASVPPTNPIPAGNYLPTAGLNGGVPGDLSALLGSPINGNWVLTIKDGTLDDVGQLHNFSIVVNQCTNPVSGGTVSGSQSICYNTAPDAFSSSDLPIGHTGTLEYQWQSSITSNIDGFSVVLGSNSSTYTPSVLTQTTWFKRLARVDCKTDWTGAAESNVVQITVEPAPISGILGKTPDAANVCEGSNVSAVLTAGSGGNGTDLTQ